MTYHQLIEKAEDWYSKKMPFVLFSFPEGTKVYAYFQNSSKKHTTSSFEEYGFVMAPFDFDKTALLLPAADCVFEFASMPELSSHPEEDVNIPNSNRGKQLHLDLVDSAIKKIGSSETKKIVVSRKKDIKLSNFKINILTDQIFTKNYNGFKYVWYHPETALWCGTTPEILLKLKDSSFSTISLAGTKKIQGDQYLKWTSKEIKEQAIVTDAIFESLQNITPVLKISKPYTHRAGNLAHLRTDVTGVIRAKNARVDKIVDALHPTPAVCGAPFADAKDFILKNETYNREFYTGFLGNVQCDLLGSNLYVNLRSMKIKDNTASIFVGGGIIGQSDPEQEWQETQNKLQTMLKVVAPML